MARYVLHSLVRRKNKNRILQALRFSCFYDPDGNLCTHVAVVGNATVDPLGESGGEESEEEWNYIPGKDTNAETDSQVILYIGEEITTALGIVRAPVLIQKGITVVSSAEAMTTHLQL